GAARGARRPSRDQARTGLRWQWLGRSARAYIRRALETAEAAAFSGRHLQLLSRVGAIVRPRLRDCAVGRRNARQGRGLSARGGLDRDLIEGQGAAVSKNALMERVWPNRIVEEGSLHVQVSALCNGFC